jgi:tetratricopeptide (TPR) repeat protein
MLARYRKDYPGARMVFEEMARDRPTNGFAVGNLALVLAESDADADRRRGLETAEAYARQNPQLADARAVYGYCLLKNGRVADAEKELTAALSGPAPSADTGYYAARLLAEKGQFGQARDMLKKALESKGAFVYRPEARALLAEVEPKAGKEPEPKKEESKK